MRSSRAPPQRERALPNTDRTPSSRIPAQPTSNFASSRPARDAQHHLLQTGKRPLRNANPPHEPSNSAAISRRASLTSDIQAAHARASGTSVLHQGSALSHPSSRPTPSSIPATSALSTSRSNLLRRKPSTIEQYKRGEDQLTSANNATSTRKNDVTGRALDTGALRIDTSQADTEPGATVTAIASPPTLLYSDLRNITPPVPNYALSATPSTRYTDSPFSHAPTPSSASSNSPALDTKPNTTPRQRPQSPTRSRPPIIGRADEKPNAARLGLPPVRESSTSSSSSTVKPSESQSRQPRKSALIKPTSVASDRSVPAQLQTQQSRSKVSRDQSKPARSSSSSGGPVRIPPEFAHLNVDPPRRPSRDKGGPPLRPSRDGTPALNGFEAPSSVVHSDLSPVYTTYHKRTPSQDAPMSATSPSLRTRLGFNSKSPSKHGSPRIDSAFEPAPTTKDLSRHPTPDIPVPNASRVVRNDSPAIGTSPSKSPRFGFFSRKPKVDSNNSTEKPKRQPSKGPAAGTGHEGYGRFGMQRRSSTTSTSTGHQSPSTESTVSSQRKRQSTSRKSSGASKDGYELDEFLRERLSPVILRGSGSTTSNTTSYSDAQNPSGPHSSNNSSLDSVPRLQLLPSALDSAAGLSPAKRSMSGHPAPSDSSEDDVSAHFSALTRSGLVPPSPHLQNPRDPILTGLSTDRPRNSNIVKPILSDLHVKPSKSSSVPGKESLDLRATKVEAEGKASRRWNFFQRAQASPRDKGKAKASVASVQTRGPEQHPPYVPAAHYAMLDPVELIGLEEVEKMIQEPETSPEDSNSETYPMSRVSSNEPQYRSILPFPPASDYSDDSEFHTRLLPPQITVRHESQDSSKLMYAEWTVPHVAPHVVDIRRSPSLAGAGCQPEQKVVINDLKPSVAPSHDAIRTPDAPQSPFDNPDGTDGTSPQRLPRLSPIGRIPKVVSKRDRERKLSDSSFSRPFARDQPKPTVKPPGSLYNQIRDLASPAESNSQPVSSTSTNSNALSGEPKGAADTNFRSLSTYRSSVDAFERGEFFTFPSRKDSDVSYSSSSGNNSILAILAAQPPQEDDIWNEYNDLLDEVMPEKAHYSYASSLGAPFHYSSALYDSPEFQPHGWYPPPALALPVPPRSHTVPAVLSVPQQIARFMQPSFSPLTTPYVLSEVFSDYAHPNPVTLPSANRMSNVSDNTNIIRQSRSSIPVPRKASIPVTGHSSIPGPTRTSLPRSSRSSLGAPNRSSLPRSNRSSIPSIASANRHSRGSAHSRSASLPEANARNSQSSLTPSVRFNRETQLLDIAEVDGDEHAAAARLRFGALMTSKWLSFGRVLFSPAHNEMRLADEARVLIIDGLGSDWSYYVAISYPTATIYDLGPPPANGVSDWPGVSERPPSNHRHINHAAISAAFPFPKGFFTAVVLRFPLATTDQAYQACIYECKRVLRPGGFLEVAALDLDLMNMGIQARKELRGLKTRLQQQRQDVSLRNLSDMLVGLIGRRGFEDVQRCIVGVPAAGHIPKSQDMSSVSSGISDKHTWQRADRQSQEVSFADLLDDARANQLDQGKSSDENITKMVAKVGRWWFTTCYEKAILRTDNSIWNNTTLLRECEKQGTSFRLLICYAQKPAQTRRRTVSV